MRRTTGVTPSPSPAISGAPVFRAIVLSAAAAGIAAGLLVSAIQPFTTTPLILAAERYEHRVAAPSSQRAPAGSGESTPGHDHEAGSHETWKPSDGVERLAYTALANLVAGAGFGLILTACFALTGRPVDGRAGLMWGAAGYAVFTLAPGLGLPPELPGTASPDLATRQLWWAFAASGAAAGLWLLAFRRGTAGKALGVVLLALPHLVGAPGPDRLTNALPPELAAHFATASMVTSAIFWAALGWVAGETFGRFRSSAAAAPNLVADTDLHKF